MFNQFKPGEKEWNELVAFAKKDSVNLAPVSIIAKTTLLEKMQALLARQIWRTQGYYEIDNHFDDVVQKALEVVK